MFTYKIAFYELAFGGVTTRFKNNSTAKKNILYEVFFHPLRLLLSFFISNVISCKAIECHTVNINDSSNQLKSPQFEPHNVKVSDFFSYCIIVFSQNYIHVNLISKETEKMMMEIL